MWRTDGYGYDPIDIVILTDEDKPDQVQPTRHNIVPAHHVDLFAV